MSDNININNNGLSDADIKKYEELYKAGNKTVVNQVKLYCDQTDADDKLDKFESNTKSISNNTDSTSDENKNFIKGIFDWFKDALGFNIDLNSIPDSSNIVSLNSNDTSLNLVNEDGKETNDSNFSFASAFEYFNDTKVQLNNDVLSLVIPKLYDSLKNNTITNINTFIDSIDFSNLTSDTDVSQTKSALKSVLSNIASSYGNSSNNLELSASDFASFGIVSNLMNKFNVNDKDTREKLTKILSENILNSNGNIDNINSQIKELLGSNANEDYIKQTLSDISKLNEVGEDNTIARRDMWQFGLNTLESYIAKINTTPATPSDSVSLNETPPVMPSLPVKQSASNQEFDKNGNLKYEKLINTDGATSDKYYNYKGGKLSSTQETVYYPDGNYTYIYKDASGKLKEVQKVINDKKNNTTTFETIFGDGTSYRNIYEELENGGRKSSLVNFDKDGNLISKQTGEYDKKGNGTSITYNKNGEITDKEVSVFDENTKIKTTASSHYDKNGNVFEFKTLTYYDETGRELKSEEFYGSDNKIIRSVEYTYSESEPSKMISVIEKNSKGNIIQKTDYSNPEYTSETFYLYDENGKQISTCNLKTPDGYGASCNENGIIQQLDITSDAKFEAPQKAVPNHVIMVSDFETNENIAEFRYDADGNLITSADSISQSIYDALEITENPINVIFNNPKTETDSLGRATKIYPDPANSNNYYEISYNKDGSYSVSDCNKEGIISNTAIFDKDGKFISDTKGTSVKYDEQGRVTEKHSNNANTGDTYSQHYTYDKNGNRTSSVMISNYAEGQSEVAFLNGNLKRVSTLELKKGQTAVANAIGTVAVVNSDGSVDMYNADGKSVKSQDLKIPENVNPNSSAAKFYLDYYSGKSIPKSSSVTVLDNDNISITTIAYPDNIVQYYRVLENGKLIRFTNPD